MSGDILTYPTDSAVSADDFVSTEKVSGNRVFRQKVNPESLKIRDTLGNVQTLKALADTASSAQTTAGGGSAADNATAVGALATAPLSGTVTCTIKSFGKYFTLDFVLTAAQIPVTDAAGSGSSGSLKLFTFVQAGVVPLGCRQNYTAFAEGAALTGEAGDAAFVMGLGSAAADAGDGALTGTEVDFGAVTGTITLSGGTGTGTKFSGAGLNSSAGLDGTATPVDLYLNWSGSADTIDDNSTIDVTGTITVVAVLLGDD